MVYQTYYAACSPWFFLWFAPLAFKTQIKGAGSVLQKPTLRCGLRSSLPYYRPEYDCVSASKLWQTLTFLFSAKLCWSVNFFPPKFISEKPLQCLYHLLFGRLALVGRQRSCTAGEDFSSGRIHSVKGQSSQSGSSPVGWQISHQLLRGREATSCTSLGIFTEMYRLMKNLKIRL